MKPAQPAPKAGTLPRPLAALGAMALVMGTGVALWFLPTQPQSEWATPAIAADRPIVVQPAAVVRSPTASVTSEPQSRSAPPVPAPSAPGLSAAGPSAPGLSAAGPSAPGGEPTSAPGPTPRVATGPSGFVTFVDAVRHPTFDPLAALRRTGVRWYTIGHVSGDECAPRWGGVTDLSGNPVAARIPELRKRGGEAILAFGGATGRELSATCDSDTLLLSAYRKVIGAFDVTTIDFEVRDSTDTAVTRRRAAAIVTLQREARKDGGSLAVNFTLPATTSGLSIADADMVRATHAAGAEISTVNLLVPFKPGADGNVARLMAAARAAHIQVCRALNIPGRTCWERLAITAVLAGSEDLSLARARLLARFRTEATLAWLSIRGAAPAEAVTRALAISHG